MCNEHLVRGGIDARIDIRAAMPSAHRARPRGAVAEPMARRAHGSGLVIDFRTARIEQQQTVPPTSLEIPTDAGAEIVSLSAEREQRAKPARQVEAMPAADLVKAWDGRKGRIVP